MLLITGFFCKKYGIFNDATVNAINKFIVFIGYPCLILGRLAVLDMDHSLFINFLLSLFINLGLLLLFGAYARLYSRGRRFPEEDKPDMEFSIMSPNNGFMGFPVAISFFGDIGLLYMIGSNVALNTMFFTYGSALMKRGREIEAESVPKKLKKLLISLAHPTICAAFVGILICYSRVELPGFAIEYLNIIGPIAPALAMISIGTMLAGGFGPHSFRKRIVMEPVLNRLLVTPLITFIVLWFLPIDPFMKTILIVSSTMPVAAFVPIISEQHGRNKSLAGETVVISTLFSMATIPFAIWILNNTGF